MTDRLSDNKLLVDGGALLSIQPPSQKQRKKGPIDQKLRAANGTEIACYGSVINTIKIGSQSFTHEFVLADVQSRILGADFLAKNYLAPNHRDATLIDLKDYSTLPAEHARGFKSVPINFINQIEDPYYSLLDKYPEIVTPSFTIKEPQHGVKHHIPTTGQPIQSRARRLNPEKLAVAKAELEKLVDLGVCYRGKSEWSSPLLVTTKPNGGWRVCGDYRRLNGLTTDDRYPVRSLQDFTAELHGKSVFSKIDLMKGYHQIPVADDDIGKTAVITPFGLFIFPRTPFGLKNAGQDFQRLMDAILGDLPRVYVYIDDILVASENMTQHLKDLEAVFKTLSANGLVVQRSKCVLGVPNLEFLGYHVDSTGIAPLPERVKAIRAATPPTSIKELQRFLGMIGYYRRFIPKAATHLYHLFEALKGKPKTLDWTRQCQESFEATKEALAKATLLFHPRPGATLALTTDASNLAVGGVLEQRGPNGWEPLAFYSSKLMENQKLWPPYDRELLGAFKGVRHFRDLIEGRAFTLYTDHQSLVPSMTKKTDPQTARQTYQLSCISEYTTDIRYVQGKANLVADSLSRPNEEAPDVIPNVNSVSASSDQNDAIFGHTHQPNRPISDRSETATSLGPSPSPNLSAGSTIPTTNGPTATHGRPTSSSTSPPSPCEPSSKFVPNPSENFRDESTLPRNPTPIDPSAANRAASAAKKEASVADLNCVIAAVGDMSIDWEEVARQQVLDPEFRRLRTNARSGLNFKSVNIGSSQLIVDTSNGPFRPYIPFPSRRRIFDVIHGLGHPGVERTRQTMCSKFVWPSIREDSSRWARECLACQQAKVTRHVTPPIGAFEVPNKRFDHLNMDIVTLPFSNGYKYLLTAVDRFTRWPIAIPMSDMTAESVVDAFSHGWVQHFGIPSTITTDRGAQFSSDLFRQLNRLWGIKLIMTTPYHPEANGLVERMHRRLKEALIALGAESSDQWFWRLPCVLLAIRTTMKPDVGASPADLVFGEGLAVPGETLPSNPGTDPQLARQRNAALADARLAVARLQPTQTSAHRVPLIHLPQELSTCTHVFVRRGGIQPSLSAPYVGPYRVISRNSVNFKLAIPGRAHEVVAICRVKPVFADAADADDAEPASPPPAGRPPRPPRCPPPPRPPSRRRDDAGREEDDVPPPTPPPDRSDDAFDEGFPPTPPLRRNRRRRRPRRIESDDEAVDESVQNRRSLSPVPRSLSPVPIVPNPPDDEIVDTTDADLPPPSWFDLSDDPAPDLSAQASPVANPAPPVPPPSSPPAPRRGPGNPSGRQKKRKQGNPNWVKGGSMEGSCWHGRRRPDVTAIFAHLGGSRSLQAPRRRLFSHPKKGDFSYRPPPQPRSRTQPSEPEVAQQPQNEPITRFFSENGRFSRRRPDINTFDAMLRQHLDIPTPSPTLNDSGASTDGFFPQFINHV